jgi:RNA polymerase sigma-70 factor (ECF subfamily)
MDEPSRDSAALAGPDTEPGRSEAGSPRSEAELVEAAQKGDRRAFAELVRLHREGLSRLVGRYLEDEDDVAEIVQRAFIRAYDNLSSFRGQARFRTWLFRIAINLSLNQLRDSSRTRPLHLSDLDAITNSLSTARLVAREARRRLGEVLQKLPPMQRLAVELRLLHELPFREIAEIAECSEDSAKANFHHGIKRLREAMAEYER